MTMKKGCKTIYDQYYVSSIYYIFLLTDIIIFTNDRVEDIQHIKQ